MILTMHNVYFIGSADKICILAKNELWKSQDRFWSHFGCFLGAWGSLKWGTFGSRRVFKKTPIFEIPFFSILINLGLPGGAKSSCPVAPFSFLFRSLGLICLVGAHIWHFWKIVLFRSHLFMIFGNILSLIFANAFVFAETRVWQKSPRFCQDSGRNRQDQASAHISTPGV